MAFIFGILASFFAFILQGFVWVFHADLFTLELPLTPSIFFSFVFLAFAEEVSRILFSRQYVKTYSRNHVLLGAIFFAVGFASLEIILSSWGGFSWKALGASSFHVVATLLTFWWIRENNGRMSTAFLIILLTALHTCFNLGILLYSPIS